MIIQFNYGKAEGREVFKVLCAKNTNLLLNEIPVFGQDKELYLYIVMKKPRVQSVFQKVRVIRL